VRRFKFRFEAVKKQRSALLDAAQAALAMVLRRHELATRLLEERRAHVETLSTRGPTGAFDPHAELVRQRHLQAVRLEIGRRETQLERLDEELNEARESVAGAHRELRAMEILEERDRDVWKAEARRLEQLEADERNAQRFERD